MSPDKLGAIGDICLAVNRHELANDDLIVVAGDNLFSEPLDGFARAAKTSEAMLATYDVGDLEAMKKYASITTDADGVITRFEEKPPDPKNTMAGIALYYYPTSVLPMIHQYIEEGNNPDQPGRLVQWLYPRVPFYTWKVPGLWFDVGSLETLEEANQVFSRGFNG